MTIVQTTRKVLNARGAVRRLQNFSTVNPRLRLYDERMRVDWIDRSG
jgi:hypothetical protein